VIILAKRKKRSGRHRTRIRKDRHKKRHKKKGKDKAEKQKPESRKKKRASKEKNHVLNAEFKARRRKQDIIFVTFIILFTLVVLGGYYLYYIYGDTSDGANDDTSALNDENNGASDNGGDHTNSNTIEWHSYDEGLKLSKSQNKPVMIDFYFDGCYWCDELDKNTYSDSRVIEKAKNFVSIKLDIYETDAYDGQGLAIKYDVQGCPTIVFLNVQGNEVNRVGGYEDANQFLADMDEALNKS